MLMYRCDYCGRRKEKFEIITTGLKDICTKCMNKKKEEWKKKNNRRQ